MILSLVVSSGVRDVGNWLVRTRFRLALAKRLTAPACPRETGTSSSRRDWKERTLAGRRCAKWRRSVSSVSETWTTIACRSSSGRWRRGSRRSAACRAGRRWSGGELVVSVEAKKRRWWNKRYERIERSRAANGTCAIKQNSCDKTCLNY